MELEPITVAQAGGDTWQGYCTFEGLAALRSLGVEQGKYLRRCYVLANPPKRPPAMTARMVAVLRWVARTAKSQGKPMPVLRGVLLPGGTWQVMRGGVMLRLERDKAAWLPILLGRGNGLDGRPPRAAAPDVARPLVLLLDEGRGRPPQAAVSEALDAWEGQRRPRQAEAGEGEGRPQA